MQKCAQAQRKVTSLLLIFTMLFLSIAVFIPVTSFSAGNDTPTDLMCMHPTSSQSYYSNSIKLRFAFTINSTYSGNVGIVYSFSNELPTIGGSECTNKTATVYPAGQTISWHGNPMSPGSGRKWAISETNTIQNAKYNDPLYVRAYVKNGSTTTYSELLITSVMAVFLREWNESSQIFDNSYFGGVNNIATDLDALTTTHYNDPLTTPTVGQHPRVLFTESALPGIRTALENATEICPWPDKGDSPKQRYNAVIETPPLGYISSSQYDGKMLDDIQLLALIYQMTGNQTYGYCAIFAIKNYLKIMGTWDYGDVCRYYGHVMYTAACVYDWCYDLLTTKDKQQIVAGVQHKCCEGGRMEVNFPPKDEGAMTGHGSEFQLLRDYLSFAIAIYDEYPGWWDYIAGRFYQEFVPARNEYYKAGMVPQGVSLYIRVRFAPDLYSAWLIKAATGTFPYASQSNMQKVMRTVYAYELPRLTSDNDLHAFGSGDDHKDDSDYQDYGRCSLIASYLFNDKTARAMLERLKWSYSVFDDSLTKRATVAEYLICSSSGVEAAPGGSHSGVKRIVYNGGWLGQIITRNTWWGDNQAAVLMKIGCRTTGNHDHADAGQFQIWYKGMLAGDTGSYDTYNDNHFKKYHQATVAHNCIVLANDEGQKRAPEPLTCNAWLSDDAHFKTGTVTGLRYGFMSDDPDAPDYAYIAGDLTPAYSNTGKVSSYERRMLTVYDTDTDGAKPFFFFVYDNITTSNANIQKKFLLHVPNYPEISGNTVTVTNDDGGKLVLQNVFGGSTISRVGGIVFSPYGNFVPSVSSNYKVNGIQIYTDETHYDGYWGRVEIKTNTSSANSELLNAMYVCDATDNNGLTAQGFSSSQVKGTVLGNTVAVFVSSPNELTSSYTFSVPGSGDKWYYVSGVADGSWTVKRNGTTVGDPQQASGGLLIFPAQTGTIQIVRTGN